MDALLNETAKVIGSAIILFSIILLIICLHNEWAISRLLKCGKQKQTRIDFIFSVQPKKGKKIMNTVKITTEQQVPTMAKFTTIAGIVAAIFGVPIWLTSDESVAQVKPSEDGLSAMVVSVGPGKAVITMNAEGDPSPGADPLTASFEVQVITPEAANASLTIGTPELKPVAAPAENSSPRGDTTATDAGTAAQAAKPASAPLPPPV